MTGSVAVVGDRSTFFAARATHALSLENPSQFGVVLGAAIALKVCGQLGISVCAERLAARVAASVRRAAGAHVFGEDRVRHNLAQTRHQDHGGLRVGISAEEIRRGVVEGLVGRVRAACELVPLLVVAVLVAPRWAIAWMALFVPVFMALAFLRRAHKRIASAWMELRLRAQSALSELFALADLVRVYGKGKAATARLDALEVDFERATVRSAAWSTAMSCANEIVGALFVFALVAHASPLAPSERVGLVPLIACVLMSYRPLKALGEARIAIARAEAALTAIDLPSTNAAIEFLTLPPAETSATGKASLVLRNVRVAHGKLGAVNLSIAPGELVAWMGPTGLGKTTLLRAMLGLEPFVSGEMIYAGAPIEAASLGAARPFAWVPQHAPMLHAGIVENVAFLESEVSESDRTRILAWCETLGLGELATRSALDCTELSGGEKQIVAIVRALMTNAPVILLDEPTSGLDAASEALVGEALQQIVPQRTVVVVTHRASTAGWADRTILFPQSATARELAA